MTDSKALNAFMQRLGYLFQNIALLEEALHHSGKGKNNEHLEFLGDRVLGLAIAGYLTEAYRDEPEGHLARRLASLVSHKSCSHVAERWDIASVLRTEHKNIVITRNMQADCCEAVLAAIYLDGGMDAAEEVIFTHWEPLFERMQEAPIDGKTALQEWAVRNGYDLPVYKMVKQAGPDHAPVITASVTVEGFGMREAEASSRRAAEQLAAQALLHSRKNG